MQIKSLNKFIITLLVTFMALLGLQAVLASNSAQAIDFQENVCKGANFGDDSTECPDEAAETKINDTLKQVVDTFTIIVGIVAVIMLVYAGLRYITSGGSKDGVQGAQKTIIYVIIGIIVIILSQTIVFFVSGFGSDDNANDQVEESTSQSN